MTIARGFLLSHLTLSDAERAWIGAVAVESAYLEKLIEQTVWALSGLSSAHGQIFTDSTPFSRKVELLDSLGKAAIVDEAELEAFSEILRELRGANTDRNTIIHGQWERVGRHLLR